MKQGIKVTKATLVDGKSIEFEPDTDLLTVIKRLLEDVPPGGDLSGVTLEYKVKKGSDIID